MPALARASVLAALSLCSAFAEPNPPTWPRSVKVFSPSDSFEHIQETVNQAFERNGGPQSQWSWSRHAFLFKPGSYTNSVPIGFYTSVYGLGALPKDVVFTGDKGVFCEATHPDESLGALRNFWRSAENFQNAGTMIWAVSQAAPLRRVLVNKDLHLSGAGNSSGGFMANSQVDGTVKAGTQQQWFTRNSKVGGWTGGAWYHVFVGTDGALPEQCAAYPLHVTLPSTPLSVEKPYITFDASKDKYFLNIPTARRESTGTMFEGEKRVDFEEVYVSSPKDTAADINVKLDAGLHVVLSPAIYHLDHPLRLKKGGQVLLGMGFATLVSTNGNAVVEVGDVDGVRVAGLLLQAGPKRTEVLLKWGTGGHAGKVDDPGALSDVFARVGGTNPSSTRQVQADTMISVQSGYVIGDNLWLWRADHDVGGEVSDSRNYCATGLEVRGDDVHMYGLAVEHTLADQVSWHGERGRTYFYQSELPLDVTQENYGNGKFVGYRVYAKDHEAYGVGVHHLFRDHSVTIESAIAVPETAAVKTALSVYLGGSGVCNHVVNDQGEVTHSKSPLAKYCPTRRV